MNPLPLAAALLLTAALAPVPADAQNKTAPRPAAARRPLWVTGYYPAWKASALPPAEIDFRAVTHVVHFSLLPTADGTGLDATKNGPIEAQASAVVAAARKAKRKALICVGGAESAPALRAAIAPARRDAFVRLLVDWAVSRGYDGIDIDMEPVTPADAPDLRAFLRVLRAALDARKPGLLLTAAVQWHPEVFAPVAGVLDQINLMAYDLAGPWQGWETWHNAALYSGGLTFTSDASRPLPSVDALVKTWTDAGVPRARLGLGLPFYGVRWTGATGPNQPIDGVSIAQVAYADLFASAPPPATLRRHDGPGVPYLAIEDAADPTRRAFVSYDDPRSVAEKVRYARREGLGGVMVWELSQDRLKPTGGGPVRAPLLDAVRGAIAPPKR